MGSKWALAASFALAIFAAAGEAAIAQTPTEWDDKAEPIEGRPGEYRTITSETWIRLTPYVGAIFWSGGTALDYGPQIGFALEFEPADLMLITFDFGSNLWNIENGGAERQFTEGRNGTDGDVDLDGREVHLAFYLGLKNPELKLGIMQPIIGLGAGVFYLFNYNTEDSAQGSLPVAGGGFAEVEFENSMIGHATLYLRFDFDISERVKFGVDLRHHVLLYVTNEFLGNMEPDKFGLDNLYYAFEPIAYFSVTF